MMSESNMGNLWGTSEACVKCYKLWLSIQHCLRGENVHFFIGVTEKRQELEFHKDVWVFQVLLVGIVNIALKCSLDIQV